MAVELTNKRQMAGYRLAAQGVIEQTGAHDWFVRSSSGNNYTVTRHVNPDDDVMWECECPDHVHREVECKHIHAVQIHDAAMHRYRSRVRLYGKALADLEVQIQAEVAQQYENHMVVRLIW